MKKRIRAVFLICVIAILCISSVFTLSGCDKNDEPRDVELEVINPNAGEVLNMWEHFKYPGKNTLIEVRVKDKKTGAYLTDDDLPDNTVRGCLTFYLKRLNENFSLDRDLSVIGECYYNESGVFCAAPYGVWPQNEEGKHNLYQLSIWFDCKPKHIQQSDFRRKYNSYIMTPYLWFYVD